MKTIAAFLIILSSFFLLKNLGIIKVDFDFWGIFWPLFFLAMGLKMFFGQRKEKGYGAWGWTSYPRVNRNDQNCGCGPDCDCGPGCDCGKNGGN